MVNQKNEIAHINSEELAKKSQRLLQSYAPVRRKDTAKDKAFYHRLVERLAKRGLLPDQIRHSLNIETQIKSEVAEAESDPHGENVATEQIRKAYSATITGEISPHQSLIEHTQQSGPNCLIASTVMATRARITSAEIIKSGIELYPSALRFLGTVQEVIEKIKIPGIVVEKRDITTQQNMMMLKNNNVGISRFKGHLDRNEVVVAAIRTPLALWDVNPTGSGSPETIGHAIVIEGYGKSSENEDLYFIHDPMLPDGPTPINARTLHSHLENSYLVFIEK